MGRVRRRLTAGFGVALCCLLLSLRNEWPRSHAVPSSGMEQAKSDGMDQSDFALSPVGENEKNMFVPRRKGLSVRVRGVRSGGRIVLFERASVDEYLVEVLSGPEAAWAFRPRLSNGCIVPDISFWGNQSLLEYSQGKDVLEDVALLCLY